MEPWMVIVGVQVIVSAAAWGDLRAQVASLRDEQKAMRKMLGNGEPGVFVRKPDMEVYVQAELKETRHTLRNEMSKLSIGPAGEPNH